MSDEFYIGWEDKAAPGIGRAVRLAVVLLGAAALLLAVALAISQHMIGASTFEWGTQKTFSGVLQSQPYPHLMVPRPGNVDGHPRCSTYYLVAPWKFGLSPDETAAFDGKAVTLKGTLIYCGNQTMIEVAKGSIQPAGKAGAAVLPETIPLGRQTLSGEIVDSKCYFGVMNPGQLTPHRSCAIRCISGGIPPILLVRQRDGPAIHLLLVSEQGKPVNREVLDLVAEPVEITGEVERQGEQLILRADPATYKRINSGRKL